MVYDTTHQGVNKRINVRILYCDSKAPYVYVVVGTPEYAQPDRNKWMLSKRYPAHHVSHGAYFITFIPLARHSTTDKTIVNNPGSHALRVPVSICQVLLASM